MADITKLKNAEGCIPMYDILYKGAWYYMTQIYIFEIRKLDLFKKKKTY